jgi:hypothetical protein
MKKIIPILSVLLASSIGLASCGNSTPAESKSYKAGVAWVRNDFPGTNESNCLTSMLNQGPNCTPINSGDSQNEFCASNGATLVIVTGNYNMQQWINGCASVPFKHYPKWLKNYLNNN